MPSRRKQPGIGAVGKTKMVNLHPSQPLKERFGTGYEHDYLDGLVILGKDRGKVSKKGRVVERFSVQHPDLPNIDFFYVAAKNFTVVEEGNTPFKEEAPAPIPTTPTATEDESEHPLTQPGRTLAEGDIAELRARGITVDDDDEPDE